MNELMVVVAGLVELRRSAEWKGDSGRPDEDSQHLTDDGRSINLGNR